MMNNNTNNVPIYDSIEEYHIKEFLAVGGESVVFKGVKISVGRTYALKFRDKDRIGDFFDYEMKTLSKLEQCSTSKLAGVIPDISHDLMKYLYNFVPPNKQAKCNHMIDPNMEFFCIVEDYISGCDLHEYCRGNAAKGIAAHTPGSNATYEEVFEFQMLLISWIKQFCEIMINVTEKNKVLHLDIKPDNVMVSNETGSLTVIDFGKSLQIPPDTNHVSLHEEFYEDVGVYGTNGYAPPECCDHPDYREIFNIKMTGVLDERSDIFSFGALLWDCINPQEGIVIKETDKGYFRRDLFNTPVGYTPEIEAIVVKCTEKSPSMRFQTYEQLKKAAVDAEKKLLERDKPSKTMWFMGILSVLSAILLVAAIFLNIKRDGYTFEIAELEFNEMAEDYTEHELSDYKEKALAYITANKDYNGNDDKPYMEVLNVALKDDDIISSAELNDVLAKCVSKTNTKKVKEDYVNTMIKHSKENELKNVAKVIVPNADLNIVSDCPGMKIAKSILDYENFPVDAYNVVKEYASDSEYRAAVGYLAGLLYADSNCKDTISQQTKKSVEDIGTELNGYVRGGRA